MFYLEGLFGCLVVLISSVPGLCCMSATQAFSKKINVEEDKLLQVGAILPQLDHQIPEDVHGAAHIHHCRIK